MPLNTTHLFVTLWWRIQKALPAYYVDANMEVLVKKIISDSADEFLEDIVIFEAYYGSRTTFEELNADQLREKLWETLFRYLSNNAQCSAHYCCLSILRILSRDKTNLNELITDEKINVILDKAGLKDEADIKQQVNIPVAIAAGKLLCNLIFNSTTVQQALPITSCLSCLIKCMKEYNNTIPQEIILLNTRILFLITALNISTQQVVKTLNGDEYCIKILENISAQKTISEMEIMLTCEILKVLFNLYMHSDDSTEKDEKNKNLVSVLYILLPLKCKEEDDLQSNIVNLLTVIPYDCYSTIIPVAQKESKHVFQDRDMTAVSILLKFLYKRLYCGTESDLSPIVTAFIRLVKAERLIRKYTRLQILPPLKDVMHRPEEGTTLRAKLCKLLTSPSTMLRDLVAEFLFILCKENVSRMVKYTGYGNAAGMFANKGLLGPDKGKAAYSSESEDSETEEYLKHKEQINPVTGCFEPSKSNPLEGMTEEQKEYEALQLVRLINALTKEGLVQPCRIGDDGKPKPIEHVLELQKQLPKQQYGRRDSDSD
ncbi:ric8 guanine nucleotide exchange factor A isoform X2 [Ptiloglossa arizonensis]|uniref:ric8 guanine nucleotide exchange factor A isoform X2 n=1 Tax=Ptiloglossa arizonensis TaxID=3350558 RepID=UPI003FA00334